MADTDFKLPPAVRRLLEKKAMLEANPIKPLYPDYGLKAAIARNQLELKALLKKRSEEEAKQLKADKKNGIFREKAKPLEEAQALEQTQEEEKEQETIIAEETKESEPELSLLERIKLRKESGVTVDMTEFNKLVANKRLERERQENESEEQNNPNSESTLSEASELLNTVDTESDSNQELVKKQETDEPPISDTLSEISKLFD